MTHPSSITLTMLASLLAMAACTDGTLGTKPEDTDGSGTDSETSSTSGPVTPSTGATSVGTGTSTTSGGTGGTGGTSGPEVEGRMIDLVFVIDNSGSTASQQRALVDGVQTLLDTLDAAADPVDYRIAVTTTDLGNPWCAGTTPEAGSLVSSSCTERLEDFVFEGSTTVDMTNEACLDVCELESLGLPEPWIDVASTGSNLPDGVSALDATRCLLPQGITGCGFESPLEATRNVMQRLQTPSDPAFVFGRPGALLAFVLVTDEADCSAAPEHLGIFLPDGNKVFWTDPDQQASPTSGVCWNAGVECSGGPGVYLDCTASDHAIDGSVTDDPTQAVLYPVRRYVEALGAEVGYFAAITGVQGDGSIVYADGPDPSVTRAFGIGYGCSSDGIHAVPPVRIRSVAQELGGDLYSACQADYAAALGSIAQRLLERLP